MQQGQQVSAAAVLALQVFQSAAEELVQRSLLPVLPELPQEQELALYASDGRTLIFSTALLAAKTTRATQGVAVMALKKNAKVTRVQTLSDSAIGNQARYRAKSLPAAGALLRQEDTEEQQISLDL